MSLFQQAIRYAGIITCDPLYRPSRLQPQLPAATPRQRFIVCNQDQGCALRAVEFEHQFDDLRASGGI